MFACLTEGFVHLNTAQKRCKINLHSTTRTSWSRRGLLTTIPLLIPSVSLAIDVSSLRIEGGASSTTPTNTDLANQLRSGSYGLSDGSASTRVNAIKEGIQASNAPAPTAPAPVVAPQEDLSIAQFAMKTSSTPPTVKPNILKTQSALTDFLVSPSGGSPLQVSFSYPTDWLQLDRATGGLQYVDQRNGDKLYVLRANLPADTTLATVNKSWFADVLFDSKGGIAKSGQNVESPKVLSSEMLSSVSLQTPRRRLLLKYSTVTLNGYEVERRGLLDCYEVGGMAYLLLVGQNAVLYKKEGPERATAENIVNSFRIES
ncbi:hypothetical protein TrLO_g9070 [Triparma laevis f. longispina]|uniref:Uncharacterized protein n=1 Tax=Triparma laevis f. longispina TaxID=1714387 RepID=A0A9W7A2F2_9STRA|nr:hypothetical protein TrLO_g9070 [Triparma laevis f. longispina]